jgi:PAS domain S-box-containing protein
MSFAFCGLESRNCRVVQRPLGSGIREQARPWPCALAVFVPILSLLVIQGVAAAQVQPTRRILILNEVNPSHPAIPIISQGIQAALSNSPYHLEFYSEYLDTVLFPDPVVQQEFRNFYIRKYRNRQPDVIITVGLSPLKFMEEAHQRAFPGVPIIFCLPVRSVPSDSASGFDFTGVESDLTPAETLKTALRLQPGTEHVVAVGGVSDWDKQEQALLRQKLKGFTDHLDIRYVTDLAVPELLKHLRRLPAHTLVLLLSFERDAEGTQFKSNEIGLLVAAAANAPVFTLYDVQLNHGEVGGYLSNLNEQGKVAGGMALRILQGEKPQDIPRVKGVNTYMFDWRAVKRWGLKESEIPAGSIVLNWQPTVWQAYKNYIIGGISLIFLESLLIGGLLWQRARRRKVEADLVVTNDRLRLALEAGKSVGWEFEVRSGRDQWFGDLQTMFGIPADRYSGGAEHFYRFVHPEDRERVRKAVAGARQSRNPYMAEFRIVRPDGAVRWVTARGTFYYAKNGDPERMLGMSVDITDRKQAEQELHASENRLAGIVGSAMDAIIAVDEEKRIVLFNAAAEKMFGCTKDEAVGTVIDRFIPERYRSEHDANMRQFAESGVTSRIVEAQAGLWAVRSNGQEFPMEASITHLESEGRSLFTVTIRDITGRRRAEEAIRESEERFRLVANTAPVMIWMSGTYRLCNYLNTTWLEFTGRPLEAELGDGWLVGVHQEDLKRLQDTFTRAFDRRESFNTQYRLRRYDGEYRWVLNIGVPRSNPDGSFDGYIGSCIDVTERKQAEEALAGIGRRLIEAHEEERTWIARELHDDFNQRIAMLTIDLERWGEQLPDSAVEFHDHISRARQRLLDMARDIQALSHRLHSSKLEYLGIVAAAKGFCRELSEQQKIEIDFSHTNMPDGVPKEISLCLFRVLQEALQNAVKHSGVRQVAVELQGTEGEIQLTVSDLGVGFDPHDLINRHGLGLISMRERLHLAGGQISIESQPGSGTTIHARAPFSSRSDSAEADRITTAVSRTS